MIFSVYLKCKLIEEKKLELMLAQLAKLLDDMGRTNDQNERREITEKI